MPRPTKTTYAHAGRDSQMYIYRDDVEGEPFVCCFCLLRDGESFRTMTPVEMADHVDQHEAAGLRTPDALAEKFRALTGVAHLA